MGEGPAVHRGPSLQRHSVQNVHSAETENHSPIKNISQDPENLVSLNHKAGVTVTLASWAFGDLRN